MLCIRSRTSSRTKRNPWGTEAFIGEAEGNQLVKNFLRIIDVCNEVGTFWSIENPQSSRILDLPPSKTLVGKKVRPRCVLTNAVMV